MPHTSLIETVKRFPEHPGVYLMKDATGDVLYVGKALNLRTRVRSYFSDDHHDRPHIPVMLQRLATIEWIATNNETEALIVESNLVKRYKPQFNVLLRDDKHFPYLKVTANEPFPRLLVVRKVLTDGARYFGPYTDARAMRKIMLFAKKIFLVRDCNRALPLSKPIRPCINFSMGRCSAPCAHKITQEHYNGRINHLVQFLQGRRQELLVSMQQQMTSAAGALKFEEASQLRDQIKLIKDASRMQQVDLKLPDAECDVFGIHVGDRHVCLCILHFREGLLLTNRYFVFGRQAWEASGPESMLIQFYSGSGQAPPSEICIAENIGMAPSILDEWFKVISQSGVEVIVPQKGAKRQLVDMAVHNARFHLMQKNPPDTLQDCVDLQHALDLPRVPAVIEAFDIANLGSSFCVAGMVQFKNGMPNRSGYRTYKIKTVDSQDDFAMLAEVLMRRLTRLNESGEAMPDLLLIDGGKGQLGAALDVVKTFTDPPMVASLAKKEEVLFSSSCPEGCALPQSHPARRLVERIRNEVHRVANTYHKKIRGEQFRGSLLEKVSGLGKKKTVDLLRHFGSLQKVAGATDEEIAQVKGFSKKSAHSLKEQLTNYKSNGA